MKLARIEHWRCGEPMYWKSGGGYTYVWVADEMTDEEFEALVMQAQKDYLDMEQEMKTSAPVNPPGYGPQIMPNTPGDMTVAELRTHYEAAAEAYKEYQLTVQLARRPFAYWLEQRGNGKIKQFHNERPALNVELSWGHNHGVTIDHSPTKIEDYPFSEDEDDV
jgi:hypothetical protein